MAMTTPTAKATATPPAAALMPDMDALPPGGGSFLRMPDGTLVPNDPPADTATPTQATSE